MFHPVLSSTCLFLQFSVYPSLHMTPSHSMPCNHPLLAIPLTFCICHQMLLTSLTPKHMYLYSYISENKFGIFYQNNCSHRLYTVHFIFIKNTTCIFCEVSAEVQEAIWVNIGLPRVAFVFRPPNVRHKLCLFL